MNSVSWLEYRDVYTVSAWISLLGNVHERHDQPRRTSMLTRTPRIEPRLVGRLSEQRRVDEIIGAARAGRGGSLVLSGEAGIGKSTLLDRACPHPRAPRRTA
jgi:predicted ATP-dependent serine protease